MRVRMSKALMQRFADESSRIHRIMSGSEGPRKRNVKSRVIRVRLSEGEYQRLMDHAEKTRRSISEIVRRAIRAWIKEHGS
ncbi:MAG: hypothetical protein DRO36_06780 [Candidatus Hecatellales archaeon]|nr:MAG: hypothetical protein DRO36_06780 [Candidatus Hecatellales archaeon]